MVTLVSFLSFFEDRMANLGLIYFKLSLYIKVNVSIWQPLVKMAINWHKIGQMPLFGKSINWA